MAFKRMFGFSQTVQRSDGADNPQQPLEPVRAKLDEYEEGMRRFLSNECSKEGWAEMATSSQGLQRKFSNEKHQDIAQGISARGELATDFPQSAISTGVVDAKADGLSNHAADQLHKAMKASMNFGVLVDQANKSTLDGLRCNLGSLPQRLIEIGVQAKSNSQNLQSVAQNLQGIYDKIAGWSSGERAKDYHMVSKRNGLSNILRVKQAAVTAALQLRRIHETVEKNRHLLSSADASDAGAQKRLRIIRTDVMALWSVMLSQEEVSALLARESLPVSTG